MNPNLILAFQDELEKISRVRTAVKQKRRALEALERRRRGMPGSLDFHATGRKGLSNILESGEVVPGTENAQSPMGVAEAYFGRGFPAQPYYSRSTGRGVAVDHDALMRRNITSADVPEKSRKAYEKLTEDEFLSKMFGGARNTQAGPSIYVAGLRNPANPTRWVQSPAPVPVRGRGSEKSYVFAPKGSLSPAQKRRMRELRLRYIPTESLDEALERIPSRVERNNPRVKAQDASESRI